MASLPPEKIEAKAPSEDGPMVYVPSLGCFIPAWPVIGDVAGE